MPVCIHFLFSVFQKHKMIDNSYIKYTQNLKNLKVKGHKVSLHFLYKSYYILYKSYYHFLFLETKNRNYIQTSTELSIS